MTEVFTNLARSTLASGLVASGVGSDSLTVQSGDGSDLFPVLGLGGPDNFRCLLFKKSTGDVEIINVTETANDVFTITRAQESIGNIPATAFAFDAGDIIENRPTSAFLTALASGASSTNIQQGVFLYGVDGGAANAYTVTMTPTATAIVAGQEVRVKIDTGNTNTGIAATLKLDALTASPIKMNDGVTNPPAGSIQEDYTHTFIYDGTNFRLQSSGIIFSPTNVVNALGQQIKNVAAGTAATDVSTIGGSETLTNKTLTSPVIDDPIINDKPGRGIVILDDPEVLHSITLIASLPASNTFVSSSTFASTTLSNAGATSAIIRIFTHLRWFSKASAVMYSLLRKAGSSVPATNMELIIGSDRIVSGSGGLENTELITTGEGTVELDVNSDFEYAVSYSSSPDQISSSWPWTISLIGYYT